MRIRSFVALALLTGCASSVGGEDLASSSSDLTSPLKPIILNPITPTATPSLALTIEGLPEAQSFVENRPVYLHFALTNKGSTAQSGWVGAQMFPKHASTYNNVWGEWQVVTIPAGATIRGVAEIAAPRADPGVSANVYFVNQRSLVGEFTIVEGPHIVESAPVSFDVNARYSISLDSANISHTRAKYTDTDYVGMTVSANGQPVFDNSATPIFLGNVQDGVHPIGLDSGTFDMVPSDTALVDVAWAAANNGASAEKLADEILDGVSHIAAGVVSILYPGTGQTWSKVDDFVGWINSQQFAGCDGPVAMDHMTATSNVLEYKTYDDKNAPHDFADTRYYDWQGNDPAYNSQAGCGSSPRYAINWTVHRHSTDVETEWVSQMQGMTKPNGTVQFYAPDANLQWTVDGDAASNGWIDVRTGLYHAPAALPLGKLVEIRAETSDGKKHGRAYVALDPR